MRSSLNRFRRFPVWPAPALAAALLGGCPMNDGGGNGGGDGGGGNGGGNGGGGGLDAVLTNAVRDGGGDIRVGTDIVAVGTRRESGVQYLIPSRGDVDPISMSNFDAFVPDGFDVAGNWVLVRDFDGNVSLFDGENENLIGVPEAQLALVAGSAGAPEFWTDGLYAVTIADQNRVSDGLRVKLIDFTGSNPVITSFPDPPITLTAGRENEKWQAALDVANRQFVVQATNWLVLYDMDDSNATPLALDFSAVGGITNAEQIHLDDAYVIYQTFEKAGNGRDVTRIADMMAATSSLPSENPAQPLPLAFENGVFGYFANVTDADTNTNFTARVVFGQIVSGEPSITQANDARTAIGEDPEDGIVGYGCTLAITPDGEWRFLAGCGTVGLAEYFQYSTGGNFMVLDDQFDQDFNGLGMPGSEVHASNTLVAFETLDGVAYIELP